MKGAALAAACALALAAAPPAGAAFTPPRLVSGTAELASDFALDPAVSADGRWVAFTGSQAGVRGVYRKDLQTGAQVLVADGDAGVPSISADGRRVAFTTTADLLDEDRSGACTSVYVRDLALPAGAPGALLLASARDGAADGLAWGDAAVAGCPDGGAAAARGALSSDGRRIVFTAIGRSDLASVPGDPATPGRQVALRDLDARTTTLVTQTRASLGGVPQPVPGGGALAVPPRTDVAGRAISQSTATFSADGTTVAWTGIGVPQQAPVVDGLFPAAPSGAPAEWYAEPLWRRVADGPTAPTRRITGGDDDPDCGCAGPLLASYQPTLGSASVPYAGAFTPQLSLTASVDAYAGALDARTPRLSADGRTVALLANQPTPAEAAAMRTGGIASAVPAANAFVVDMTPGLTRGQAVRRLTAWASLDFTKAGTRALNDPVASIAISPDGSRVAFTTARIAFPQAPPALVTPQLSQVAAAELYQADLSAGTLSLASVGYDGTAADGDLGGPAYAGDSRTLVVSGRAANLVYGAVNGLGASALFAFTEVDRPAVRGTSTATPVPPPRAIAPRWTLGATVRRARDGSLLVDVTVPGSGTVAATAVAPVPQVVRRAVPRKRGRAARRAVVRIRPATVAAARASARGPGVVRLRIAAAKRYRSLAAASGGLDAALTVAFRRRGRAGLRQTLAVRLRARPAKRAPARRPAARRAPKRR